MFDFPNFHRIERTLIKWAVPSITKGKIKLRLAHTQEIDFRSFFIVSLKMLPLPKMMQTNPKIKEKDE